MNKNTIEQLKHFEIFVENLEELVDSVKVNQTENGKYPIERFDLRNDDGDIFSLPTKLEDYFKIWNAVKAHFEEYLQGEDNEEVPNESFFDVYYNNIEGNMAEYVGETLWLYFDSEFGIFYDSSSEIIEKIRKRDGADE